MEDFIPLKIKNKDSSLLQKSENGSENNEFRKHRITEFSEIEHDFLNLKINHQFEFTLNQNLGISLNKDEEILSDIEKQKILNIVPLVNNFQSFIKTKNEHFKEDEKPMSEFNDSIMGMSNKSHVEGTRLHVAKYYEREKALFELNESKIGGIYEESKDEIRNLNISYNENENGISRVNESRSRQDRICIPLKDQNGEFYVSCNEDEKHLFFLNESKSKLNENSKEITYKSEINKLKKTNKTNQTFSFTKKAKIKTKTNEDSRQIVIRKKQENRIKKQQKAALHPVLDDNAQNELFMFLLRLFKNERIFENNRQNISKQTIELCREILHKKFTFDEEQMTIESLKNKRNEEHFKFVVKRGFKYLFKNFKINNKGFIKGRKILDEEEFYFYYFFNHLDSLEDKIQTCFLPGSKIQKKFNKNVAKLDQNITIAYMERVFKSVKFRSDFRYFLDHVYIEDCLENQIKKLKNIVQNKTIGLKNNQNKLPWTKWEIEFAKGNFLKNVIEKK